MPANYAYDGAWSELDDSLRHVETNGGGLGRVLKKLHAHQHEAGFIRDRLNNVERYRFFHPEDQAKCFQVQYNPNRALRFKGAGIKVPPSGIESANDGCFLCRDNIFWQQEGRQLGYEIPMGDKSFYAWMNPFPLLPVHAVIAAAKHVPQDCGIRGGQTDKLANLLSDFIGLASRLPGYIGFYNGVDAGASIPGHMHFQFFARPEDHPEFPLERAVRNIRKKDGSMGILTDYPLAVAFWHGSKEEVTENAVGWLQKWAKGNENRQSDLTGNFIAAMDADNRSIMLYFVPRERSRQRASGDTGVIGGLEVLGELVYSTPEQKQMLDDGTINFFSLQSHLASVYTPFYHG